MTKHLAVFSPNVLDAIFSGRKTIDARFSKNRIAPYSQIQSGDVVYIKAPGQEIIGQFIIRKILFLEGFSKKDFDQLIKEHEGELSWGNKKEEKRFFEERREEAKYATLIWIDQLEKFLIPPVKIPKRDNRAWVVLE